MAFPQLASKLLSLACALFVGSALLAAPKRLASAKPGQCRSCHADKPPLPKDHTDTKGMSISDCRACHEKGSPTSLVGKLPSMHAHHLKGVTCAQCHGKGKPEAVGKAQCVTCHELKALQEKTAQLKPQNPHESPHGYHEDCNLCHRQHAKSENFCITCHAFDFAVP